MKTKLLNLHLQTPKRLQKAEEPLSLRPAAIPPVHPDDDLLVASATSTIQTQKVSVSVTKPTSTRANDMQGNAQQRAGGASGNAAA